MITITKGHIAEALARLGSTSDQVAASLLEQGCKGKRGSGGGCPLAKFLSKQFGEQAMVGTMAAYLWPSTGEIHAALPVAVAEFRARFDHRMYPGLDLDA